MPTTAERLSALRNTLDEAKDELSHLRQQTHAASALLSHLVPAITEASRLARAALATASALEMYQAGTSGTPVADLQRALLAQLNELSATLAANMPRTQEADTGLMDDEGEHITVVTHDVAEARFTISDEEE